MKKMGDEERGRNRKKYEQSVWQRCRNVRKDEGRGEIESGKV